MGTNDNIYKNMVHVKFNLKCSITVSTLGTLTKHKTRKLDNKLLGIIDQRRQHMFKVFILMKRLPATSRPVNNSSFSYSYIEFDLMSFFVNSPY